MASDITLPKAWEVERALQSLQWARRHREYNYIRFCITQKYLQGQPGDDDWTDEELVIIDIVYNECFAGLGYREDGTKALIRERIEELLVEHTW